MSKIIAVVNQKGGVGKTTTTLNLGYALANHGKKVLLIDLDPQGSLTISLGQDSNDELQNTIADLMGMAIMDQPLPATDEYILHIGKLDLIPCNIELSATEVNLVDTMSREMILKYVIHEFKYDYEYIIIDCSPSLGMLTVNALAACDSIIIPVTPEYLSARGIQLLFDTIRRTRNRINPNIKIDGILFTMYTERLNLTKEMKKMLEETFGKIVNIYQTCIPKSVRVGESALQNQSVIEYAEKNKVSLAYNKLAQEVLEDAVKNSRK